MPLFRKRLVPGGVLVQQIPKVGRGVVRGGERQQHGTDINLLFEVSRSLRIAGGRQAGVYLLARSHAQKWDYECQRSRRLCGVNLHIVRNGRTE